MSYIRCTSNPENLYVFESVDGLHFYFGEERSKTPINSRKQMHVCVDPKVFQQFIKKLQKKLWIGYENPVVHKNISIRDIIIAYKKDKRYVIKKLNWKGDNSDYDNYDDVVHLVCLQIDKTNICMWKVTWDYLYNNYNNFLEE